MHLFPGRLPSEIEAGLFEGEIERLLDAVHARDAGRALKAMTNHEKAPFVTDYERESAQWLLNARRESEQ